MHAASTTPLMLKQLHAGGGKTVGMSCLGIGFKKLKCAASNRVSVCIAIIECMHAVIGL